MCRGGGKGREGEGEKAASCRGQKNALAPPEMGLAAAMNMTFWRRNDGSFFYVYL